MNHKQLLAALTLCLAICGAVSQVIHFAVSISKLPPTPAFALNNNGNMSEGFNSFFQWYKRNGEPPILADGINYTLSLTIVTNNYTSAGIRASYLSLINSTTEPIFLFSPFGSLQTQYAAAITEPRDRLLVSSTASSSTWNAAYQMAFSNWPTYSSRIASLAPLLRINKMKTTAIIRASPNVSGIVGELCNEVPALLRESGIASDIYIYNYSTPLTNYSMDTVREIAKIVAEKDYDVVMVCTVSAEVPELVAATFREVDWVPKIGFASTDNAWVTNNSQYWLVTDSFSDVRQFPPDAYFGTARQYRLIDNSTTIDPTVTASNSLSTFAAYSMVMVYNAIKAAGTVDQASVADRLRRSTTDTFLGRFSFDSHNVQQFPGTLNQIVNGELHVLAPLQVAEADLIIPMPKWSERELVVAWTGVEIAVIVIVSLAILNTIFWLIWVLINRHDKTIVASAPVFLSGMLLGSIFIYVSQYLSIPYFLNTEMCGARVWLLAIGTTFLMGSMLAKTWRVYALFTNSSMTVFKISDLVVAGVVVALLIPDVILLIVFQVVATPRLELVVVDTYRISKNYYTCVTTPDGTTILWVIFALHIATFAVGAFLAWKVRLIPYKVYDESKSIAFSIYNVGFFGIILAVILSVTQASQYAMFGILAFLAVFGALITINVMFGSKFYWVKNGFSTATGSSGSGSGGAARTTNSSSSMAPMNLSLANVNTTHYASSTPRDKYDEAQERIEKLEKRIKKLKKKLAQYQQAEQDDE